MLCEKKTLKNGLAIKRWAGVFVILSVLCLLPVAFLNGSAIWGWYALWYVFGLLADIVFVFPDKRLGPRITLLVIRLGVLWCVLIIAIAAFKGQ